MPLSRGGSDEEVLKKGLPYVRSILAFCCFMKFGGDMKDGIFSGYKMADVFINQLKKDLKEAE